MQYLLFLWHWINKALKMYSIFYLTFYILTTYSCSNGFAAMHFIV